MNNTTQKPEEILDHAIACTQGQLKELVETVLKDETNFQMAKSKYKKTYKSCLATLEYVVTIAKETSRKDEIVFEVLFWLDFTYVDDRPRRSPLVYVKSNKSVSDLLNKLQKRIRLYFHSYSTN